MNNQIRQVNFELGPRAMFSVDDIAGVEIQCLSGSLWITLDHDERDVVINAGESFDSELHRHAIVYGLEPSRVALHSRAASLLPQGIAAPQPVGRSGQQSWFQRLLTGGQRPAAAAA